MIQKLQKLLSKYRVESVLLLAGSQFVIASIATLFLPLFNTEITLKSLLISRFSLGVAAISAILAGSCFILYLWIRSRLAMREYLEKLFTYSQLRFIPVILPMVITGFLALSVVSQDDIYRLSALLICLWIICLELILFFSGAREKINQPELNVGNNQKLLAVVGCLIVYAFLFVPSRLHSSLDGLPLDNSLEFILALFIIPLTLAINWPFFSNRRVLIILGVILVLKLGVAFSLPESGLNVRLYQSAQNLADGKWEKSYASIFHPSVTQIMQAPYENTRQFPFALLTDHILNKNLGKFPWVGLTIQGNGTLEKGEKILFLVTLVSAKSR